MTQMTKNLSVNTKRHWGMARLFALVIVPLIGAFTLLEPFGRDQGIHATIAYALDDGLLTYRDVFNMKPPLTTGVHWISQAIFGHSMIAIRAFDLFLVALTALGLVEIGRKLGRSPVFGFAAPVGFALLYYSYGFWERAQTDGWAGFLVVAALWLMILGWNRPKNVARFCLLASSGVILGLAFGLKYTIGAMGGLVFAPLLAQFLGQSEQRFFLRDFFAVVLGGLAVLATISAAMAWAGVLEPFFEIQDFIRGYVGYAPSQRPNLIQELMLIDLHSNYLLVVVLLGVFILLFELVRKRGSMPLSIAIIWTIAAWISGHVQGKGFEYHYLPLLPVYAYLFGLGIEGVAGLITNIRLRRVGVILVLLSLFLPTRAAHMDRLAMTLIGDPDPGAVFRARIPAESDFDIVANVEFANIIKKRRQSGDSFFLWGYSTMLYFLVEEPPRYRFAYSWPFMLSYYDGRYTSDLLNRLNADPPKQFVVQSQDATPWVTYNSKSSAQMLLEYPAIAQFLKDNYQLVEERLRFELYELNRR